MDFDIGQAGGGKHIGDSACLGVTAFDGEEAAEGSYRPCDEAQ